MQESKMSKEQFNEKTYNLLNVILTCDILRESNEALQKTSAYQKKIKFHSNGLTEELELFLESNLRKMFNIEQDIYQNIVLNLDQYQRTMSTNIVNMKPDEFLELNQIIQLYMTNKDKFKETFEITLSKMR